MNSILGLGISSQIVQTSATTNKPDAWLWRARGLEALRLQTHLLNQVGDLNSPLEGSLRVEPFIRPLSGFSDYMGNLLTRPQLQDGESFAPHDSCHIWNRS